MALLPVLIIFSLYYSANTNGAPSTDSNSELFQHQFENINANITSRTTMVWLIEEAIKKEIYADLVSTYLGLTLEQIKMMIDSESPTSHSDHPGASPTASIIAGATVSVIVIILTCSGVIIVWSRKLLLSRKRYHIDGIYNKLVRVYDGNLNYKHISLESGARDQAANTVSEADEDRDNSATTECLLITPDQTDISSHTRSVIQKRIVGEGYDKICTYEQIQRYERVQQYEKVPCIPTVHMALHGCMQEAL